MSLLFPLLASLLFIPPIPFPLPSVPPGLSLTLLAIYASSVLFFSFFFPLALFLVSHSQFASPFHSLFALCLSLPRLHLHLYFLLLSHLIFVTRPSPLRLTSFFLSLNTSPPPSSFFSFYLSLSHDLNSADHLSYFPLCFSLCPSPPCSSSLAHFLSLFPPPVFLTSAPPPLSLLFLFVLFSNLCICCSPSYIPYKHLSAFSFLHLHHYLLNYSFLFSPYVPSFLTHSPPSNSHFLVLSVFLPTVSPLAHPPLYHHPPCFTLFFLTVCDGILSSHTSVTSLLFSQFLLSHPFSFPFLPLSFSLLCLIMLHSLLSSFFLKKNFFLFYFIKKRNPYIAVIGKKKHYFAL